jgi:hypothetical protein
VGQRALALHHRDLGGEQLVVHGDLAHFGFQPGDFVVAVIAFTFFQGCMFPQRYPRTLNPSTSARAMAAIASTACAGIMRCGVATIRGISEGKAVAPKQ